VNPFQIAALGASFWCGEARSVPESAGEARDWVVQERDELHDWISQTRSAGDSWIDQNRPDEVGGDSLADWFKGAKVDNVESLDEWFKRSEQRADGSTPFVASTDASDRHGDVVEQGTWRLKNFRGNPVILHEHGGGMCADTTVVGRGIAKIATVGKADEARRQLQIRVFWDDHESNRQGMLDAHQHRDGFRHAGSVGFRPGKTISRRDLGHGSLFRHNELLEFSSVAIPANPQALQLNSLVASLGGLDGIKSLVKGQAIDRGVLADVVREILFGEFKTNDELRTLIKNLCWGTPPTSTPTKGDALAHLFGGS
jgi:hypothetical protein